MPRRSCPRLSHWPGAHLVGMTRPVVSLILSLLSAVAGLVAAWLWWKSSQASPMPTWATGDRPDPMNEPVIKTLAQDGWIAGAVQSIVESSKWNKRAAIATAIAILLGAAASVVAACGH